MAAYFRYHSQAFQILATLCKVPTTTFYLSCTSQNLKSLSYISHTNLFSLSQFPHSHLSIFFQRKICFQAKFFCLSFHCDMSTFRHSHNVLALFQKTKCECVCSQYSRASLHTKQHCPDQALHA